MSSPKAYATIRQFRQDSLSSCARKMYPDDPRTESEAGVGGGGGSRISVAACTLYNTKTRTIKLNKGAGYFAFHLLETGSSDRAPGSTPRINSDFSYFY
jgi:hypothetical protein